MPQGIKFINYVIRLMETAKFWMFDAVWQGMPVTVLVCRTPVGFRFIVSVISTPDECEALADILPDELVLNNPCSLDQLWSRLKAHKVEPILITPEQKEKYQTMLYEFRIIRKYEHIWSEA